MEQIPILIVVIPLICSFFCPIIGLWRKEWCYPWTVFTLILCALASVDTLLAVVAGGTIHYRLGGWAPPWGIEYVIDHLNALMLVIISVISLIVAIYSKRSVEKELPGRIPYFYTIFILQVTGFVGIVITGDVFNLYVFLEIASLAGYALIAIGEEGALLASFRYIVMGTIGACFYLLGVGYIYIATGSLNLGDLAAILPGMYHSKVVLVALAFFSVGIAVKMGLFPMHVWLPDAYCTAPSSSSALLAPLMTKVAAYVMIRVFFKLFQPSLSLETLPVMEIMGWLAAVAILIGGIWAVTQRDIKRMAVYILVAEVGYIAMGVSVGNRAGLTGAILHILNDAIMMTCLFLVVGALVYKTGTRDIHQMRHLNKKMPFTMGALTIVALSMVGIPPACGFFSKWYLILGAIDAQKWAFAVILLASSLINAVLFFGVIEYAYFSLHEEAGHGEEKKHFPAHGDVVEGHAEPGWNEAPLSMLVPILVVAAGILVLGPLSGKIIDSVIRFAIPAGF